MRATGSGPLSLLGVLSIYGAGLLPPLSSSIVTPCVRCKGVGVGLASTSGRSSSISCWLFVFVARRSCMWKIRVELLSSFTSATFFQYLEVFWV